jgi:hypothetical protein
VCRLDFSAAGAVIRNRKYRSSHALQRNGVRKNTLCRICSSSPFLLDRLVAALPQFGQSEDLFKVDMACFSHFRLGSILYTHVADTGERVAGSS